METQQNGTPTGLSIRKSQGTINKMNSDITILQKPKYMAI